MSSCASLVFGRFAGSTPCQDAYSPPRKWTFEEVSDKVVKTLDENAEFIAEMCNIHGRVVIDLINYKAEETLKSMKLCGGIHDILNGSWSSEDFGELVSMFKTMKSNQELDINWAGKFYIKEKGDE